MNQKHLLLSLLPLVLKNPKLLIVALCCGGLLYTYEFFFAREPMVFGGIPSSQEHVTRIFRNQAFMLGYSDTKGNPLWVVYKLSSPSSASTHLKRPENFMADWRSFWRVSPDDYTNSGYDRGHMAPNHAIALLYGKEAQYETFLMSNITPQKPSLNQKLWNVLEDKELYHFTRHAKELWVFTGPLFDTHTTALHTASSVEIPDAFFKFYVKVLMDGRLETVGFILPQTVKANDSLLKFAVSIDEIEKKSGFDFLHALEDSLEKEIEARREVRPWIEGR